MSLTRLSSQHCFGGLQQRFSHHSSTLNCQMQFSIYLPPQTYSGKVPALFWLSGLTCTDENFSTKAGAQRYAAELGLALIIPDTSPRGAEVAVAADGAWDLGLGAGFYLNATEQPWASHYQMASYISQELVTLIAEHFPVSNKRGISGHSMGGHGALTLALQSPDLFHSVSAFSPICAPSQCPWGEKAFRNYLGEDTSAWQQYDASVLLAKAKAPWPLLVDIGDADPFLANQLKPELLQAAAKQHDSGLTLRLQPGYDHSYYFIASFIGEHLAFHAKQLAQ